MTLKIPLTLVMNAKSALNEVTDELSAVELANCQELTWYIVFSAGTASGAVQAEEAHDKSYTGTWAPNGAAAAAAASTVKTVKVTGVSQAQRCRISTVLAGGTVSIWVLGRG